MDSNSSSKVCGKCGKKYVRTTDIRVHCILEHNLAWTRGNKEMRRADAGDRQWAVNIKGRRDHVERDKKKEDYQQKNFLDDQKKKAAKRRRLEVETFQKVNPAILDLDRKVLGRVTSYKACIEGLSKSSVAKEGKPTPRVVSPPRKTASLSTERKPTETTPATLNLANHHQSPSAPPLEEQTFAALLDEFTDSLQENTDSLCLSPASFMLPLVDLPPPPEAVDGHKESELNLIDLDTEIQSLTLPPPLVFGSNILKNIQLVNEVAAGAVEEGLSKTDFLKRAKELGTGIGDDEITATIDVMCASLKSFLVINENCNKLYNQEAKEPINGYLEYKVNKL